MKDLLILGLIIIPMLSGIISWMIGRKSETYRDCFNVFITLSIFILVCLLYKYVSVHEMDLQVAYIMGTGLNLKLDMFRYIFVWITSLIWFITTIYSTQYLIKYKNRNRYYCFFMMTLGSTIGVFLSENLINLFTFFEIMSFTSYILVIHDEDEYAHSAGFTYISMAIVGGLILLLGLFLAYDLYGTVEISSLAIEVGKHGPYKYIIAGLLIIGFGVKASIVPLHIWLPKAHPAAPTPASAILSGILLKVGIFGIMVVSNIIFIDSLIISWVILSLGFINMLLGGFLALFQRNIKRILAYSSMSQIGFILVGISLINILGEHNQYAVLGTLYQIFNHAIFKVLLFLCAGVIYMIIHELSINKIRGFGRHKVRLKLLFLIGFLAIIGMPGFNGFASKNMIHEALIEAMHMYHYKFLWIGEKIFIISAALTVAYLIKIYVAVFIDTSDEFTGQYKGHFKWKASFPMNILAIIIIVLGIKPDMFNEIFAKALNMFGDFSHFESHYYSGINIRSSMISILLGLVIYIVFVKGMLEKKIEGKLLYINPTLTWMTLENNFYIPIIRFTYMLMLNIFRVIDRFILGIFNIIAKGIERLREYDLSSSIFKNSTIFIKAVKNIDTKRPIAKTKDGITTFSDLLSESRQNFNSLSYAVFIFGVILTVILTLSLL